MTAIERVRVPWSGGVGGNGVSTFYFTDASLGLGALHDFFDSLKALVPAGISWAFAGEGDIIEDTTGEITGSWSATGLAGVAATGSGNYASPTGLMFSWLTGQVHAGHRVKGRTFLVPTIGGTHGPDGTIEGETLGNVETYAATLVADGVENMLVWSRPFSGTPAWTNVHGRTHAARAAHAGASFTVADSQVPDVSVVLRSRRD